MTAIIAVIPPRYKPAEQPTNGADQPRGRSTATRLSAAPASAASDVTVGITLTQPAGVTIAGITPSSGNYAAGTWSVPFLDVGSSATLTIYLSLAPETVPGMNVVGCRRTVTGTEPCPTRTFDALDELLTWADHVVLALPLTDDTAGLIGAERLAMMKPTAHLINVGRGGLVDEPGGGHGPDPRSPVTDRRSR